MKTKSILAAMLLLASSAVMAEDYNFLTVTYGGAEQNISLPVVKKIFFQDGMVVVTTTEGNHSYPISILDKMTFTNKDVETAIKTMPEQSEALSFDEGKLVVKGSGLVRVFNTAGAMVSVLNVEEGANLNLNNLPTGVYVVRMGDQAIKVKK